MSHLKTLYNNKVFDYLKNNLKINPYQFFASYALQFNLHYPV